MTKIDEVKAAVSQLSLAEQDTLRAWLDELAEQRFDEQIARDEAEGRPETLTTRALDNLNSGRVRDL